MLGLLGGGGEGRLGWAGLCWAGLGTLHPLRQDQ